MATTIDELLRMKAKLDADRVERARLEGQLADREARLKELGYDSPEAADDRLAALGDQIAELDDKVRAGIDELREKYGL